jgi:hypothetical protein
MNIALRESMSSCLSKRPSAGKVFLQLKELAQTHQFNDGFKLIYDRWDRIGNSNVIFLSLNPGRAPLGVNREEVSDENGNTYVVELSITKSPINRQFIDLFELLGISLDKVLSGVYIPFRSNRLKDLSKDQKNVALEFSRQFWFPLVREKDIIFCCGLEVFNEIHKQLYAGNKVENIPSGWGKTAIKRIATTSGQMVIGLPHLSTFKLLSNKVCRQVLADIMKPPVKK